MRAERRDETARAEDRKTDVNHALAPVTVRPPAERNLQDRLCQTVSADRHADECQVVAPRQALGIDGKDRQDHEHPEHAQTENAGETQRRTQLLRAHAIRARHYSMPIAQRAASGSPLERDRTRPDNLRPTAGCLLLATTG